jgi:hypothetical protein
VGAGGGGGELTVTVAPPTTPSTAAWIAAVPADTACTIPVLETVATAGFPDVHVTTRSPSGVPDPSRTVAPSVVVPPTSSATVAGETITDAAAARSTRTVTVPDAPSARARMRVVPGDTPRTSPVALTVAMVGAPEDQVTVRPERAAPFSARGVAVSAVASPTRTTGASGAIATVATGTASTRTVAVPRLPSLLALTVALPGATAVTTPAASTLATVGSLLV